MSALTVSWPVTMSQDANALALTVAAICWSRAVGCLVAKRRAAGPAVYFPRGEPDLR